MDAKPATCDSTQIGRFLDDQLGDEEQIAFERHLDACPACRGQLEMHAADRELWHEARTFLSSSADGRYEAGTSTDDSYHDADNDPQTESVIGLLAPTDDPRMLGRFGGYEISGIIGYGGMGIVLKGFDTALNRYVAIKLLAPHLATSGAARRRFAREAQAAAAVMHENVVAIHCVAEANNLPYIVMPYIRGASLQKRINDQGALGLAEILRIGMQAAAGLAAAHAQGLVHRDIKPANILLEDGVERLKLTDFGLARAADDASLTRTGVIAGTPQYMSPEQARGEAVDYRSDLFSLGSVLYAMCTGRPPFRAETSYGVLRRIGESQPRAIVELNSEIPAWLVAIIERLHAKNPADRFNSADEVASVLQRCLAHIQQPNSVTIPMDVIVPKPPKRYEFRIDRRPWGTLLAFLFVVAVLLLSAGFLLMRFSPPQPEATIPAIIAPTAPIVPTDRDQNVEPDVSTMPFDDDVDNLMTELQADVESFESDLSE